MISPDSTKNEKVATRNELRNIEIFLGNNFASFVNKATGCGRLAFQKNRDRYKKIPMPKKDTGSIHIPIAPVGGWAHETNKIPKQKMLRTNDNKASNMKIITLISFLWDGFPYHYLSILLH